MGRYAIRRCLQAIPLLVGFSILVFLMLQMTPGGPLAMSEDPGGGRMTAEDLERLRNRYGLDDPIYIQYLSWARDLLQGDWGTSFNTGQPVLTMIGERLPTTLLLTGLAFGATVLIAIPVGILSAVRQYSIFDYFSTSVSFLGVSIPSFWSSLMLLYVFAFSLGWLPSFGLSDLQQTNTGMGAVWDSILHLILPVSVLALTSTAALTRYVRASLLDVIGQDYIRTARAKGIREQAVVIRHALRNAATPIITVLAVEIPDLFIGAVIVESVFAISGMGRLFVDSANLRDYPVLMGILIIAALLVIVSNLMADLIYGVFDPRVRI